MLCSRCKKRTAVVFMTNLSGDQSKTEGLCLVCAKELGIKPVNDMMNQLGISDEDIMDMSDQLENMMNPDGDGEDEDGALIEQDGGDGEDFEAGGARAFPFLEKLFGGMNGGVPMEGGAPAADTGKKTGGKKKSGEKKLKYLTNYCEHLTGKAREGRIDNIIGRDREISRVIQILSRRTKNNPCLIGEPGVGKTAIAEGIAQRIVAGDVPFKLRDKEVYLLDLTALVAGTQFRGQFEARVKGLVDEVKSEKNVILFIDEVHNLVGAGDSEGSMNAANILKPSLSRGEIQVIGATTFKEYRKYIEKDSALERRFQPVTVDEPTILETIDVLKGIKKYYEQFHKVQVPESVIPFAVQLSERYITDRFLPDKAIDLLDEACSAASLRSKELAEYEEINRKLLLLKQKEEELSTEAEPNYEEIANVRSETLNLQNRQLEIEPAATSVAITAQDIASVVELWTGIPAAKLEQSELHKIADLEGALRKKIIGQDEAIELVAKSIRRSRVHLTGRRRPASFIFVGPTGVGKTELVKVLAAELFDGVDPLIRIDMTEYMEKHALSRLIGSPPGYVGYDEAGQLTEKVRRHPYSVVLFDEIEKAHPDVLNLLLQILDEGRITDAQGRTVNFENTVIVMTSNAGAEQKGSPLGFGKEKSEFERDKAIAALSSFLRPEFMGRVDEIVCFNALEKESLQKIAGLMLSELKDPMAEKGIAFEFDESLTAYLAEKSDGGQFGARDLRKLIRKEVEDPVASLLVERCDAEPSLIKAVCKDGEVQIVSL